jgi:hypothetical protein
LNDPMICFVSACRLNRGCLRNRLSGCFFDLCLGLYSDAVVYLLGSITCRMFRLCNESLVVVDWIRLLFMEQVLFKYMRMFLYCPFQRSDPVLMQSAPYSRYREGDNEPITARINLYTCLCTQEFDTSHPPDRVQDQVARLATPSQGVCRIAGPLTEGPGPTSRPRSLPAPRVACRCPPAGFDRQHLYDARVVIDSIDVVTRL